MIIYTYDAIHSIVKIHNNDAPDFVSGRRLYHAYVKAKNLEEAQIKGLKILDTFKRTSKIHDVDFKNFCLN